MTERGGSASVEAAVLAAALGLLLALAVAGGRVAAAEATVDQAARSAARIASLQRGATAAGTTAEAAVRVGLGERGLHCVDLTVDVDVSGFARPLGEPASVVVTVSCSVSWADLGLPGAAGQHEVAARAASPIDQWRERT